jgi:hypothetical protein
MMLLRNLIIATLLLTTSSVARAQFNDTVNYYLHYAATGIINRTADANSYVFNNNMSFSIQKKSISLNTTNNWIYGLQERKLVNNDFASALYVDVYKTFPRFNYWGLATFDKSYSLKVNKRLQTGLGVAYDLVHAPKSTLNISDGILYESSDLQLNDSTDNVYNTFRNSFRLQYAFTIKEIFLIDGTHFVQHSLSYKQDYIIKSVSSFSVKLREWLRFTTSVNYNKIKRVNRENLLMTFGVTIDKYF